MTSDSVLLVQCKRGAPEADPILLAVNTRVLESWRRFPRAKERRDLVVTILNLIAFSGAVCTGMTNLEYH